MKKQINELGVAIKAIPNFNTITLVDKSLQFQFKFNYQIISNIKKILGARYNGSTKTWKVPLTNVTQQELENFSKKYKFVYDSSIIDLLSKKENIVINTDIEIKGLNGTLRPFQKEGAAYASKVGSCIIADEMGLGKTVQAIATIQKLEAYPALIICPASLKLNWLEEFSKWIPNKKGCVINGKGDCGIYGNYDYFIINYDVIASHIPRLKKLKLESIIMVEFHYCKNPKAQRTKAIKELAGTIKYKIGLTGTPILNKPIELAPQLDIIGKLDKFGGFWGFAKRYCGARRGRFGWEFLGANNLQELNYKLRNTCYIRRNKKDVLKELPPKQRSIIPIEITNRKEYDYAEKNLISWLREQAIKDKEFLKSIKHLSPDEKMAQTKAKANNAEIKALRAEQLVRIEALKKLTVNGKMDAIKEWIDNFLESGEKLVLFANHIDIQNKLLELYPKSAHVLGKDNIDERKNNVDKFQNDDSCKLIICSLVAAGVGITLTSASNVAFIELGWTPSLHDQAEDRVHRITQTNQVNIWYLLAKNTIDEEINDLLNKKREITSMVHDGKKVKNINVINDLLRKLKRNKEDINNEI